MVGLAPLSARSAPFEPPPARWPPTDPRRDQERQEEHQGRQDQTRGDAWISHRSCGTSVRRCRPWPAQEEELLIGWEASEKPPGVLRVSPRGFSAAGGRSQQGRHGIQFVDGKERGGFTNKASFKLLRRRCKFVAGGKTLFECVEATSWAVIARSCSTPRRRFYEKWRHRATAQARLGEGGARCDVLQWQAPYACTAAPFSERTNDSSMLFLAQTGPGPSRRRGRRLVAETCW